MELELLEQEVKLIDKYFSYLNAYMADTSTNFPLTENEELSLRGSLEKVLLAKYPNLKTELPDDRENTWVYSYVKMSPQEYIEFFRQYKADKQRKKLDEIFDKHLTAMTGWEFQKYLKALGLISKLRERTK